jgi:hypothetical protein
VIPETVSALELVRAVVALFGLVVSWRGRSIARENAAAVSIEPTDDSSVRRERSQRLRRMHTTELAQTGFCLVHAMLLGNALINMGYLSQPIEQANVLMSNVTQVMIPLILARVSEQMSLQIRHAVDLRHVAGERAL